MNRSKLPYRLNCEGYFLLGDNQILARDSGLGYIEFPGGGIDGYDIAGGMARECLEETGAVISGMREIGVIYFDWTPDWAKTEKQKQRYKLFRGEEMHLFVGHVQSLGKPTGDPENGDSGWGKSPLMDRELLINKIEQSKPFPVGMDEYHTKQLWVL